MAKPTYITCLFAIIVLFGQPSLAEQQSASRIKSAAAKALKLLQSSQAVYIKERQCFSCHHQSLPAMAISLANKHGFELDAKALAVQSQFTLKFFEKRRDKVRQGKSVPGGSYSAAYVLVGLGADNVSADDTTDALVAYLLKHQGEQGPWKIRNHRPPLEDSHFTATALGLRSLQLFGRPKQREQIKQRIDRALGWLTKTKPKMHEDKVFRLFGLKWAGANKQQVQAAVDDLLGDQLDDGSWKQLPKLDSDAYATGQALVALRQAGKLKPTSEAYQKGISWLLKMQKDDGSWRVQTRSKPIQTYFESGFPHGKSQFISICATSWASMALVLASDAPSKGKQVEAGDK